MQKKIIGILTLVIVGVLLIGVLSAFLTNDDEREWYFDDYVSVSDNISLASGSLEILNIDGKRYLHAHSVGSGYYVDDGKKIDVYVKKAKLDVYMLAGQSNATYSNPDLSVAVKPMIGTGYYYGTQTTPTVRIDYDPSICQMYDLIDPSGSLRVGDKAPAFVKTYYEKTGHKVFFITAGISGESIENFQPYSSSVWLHMDSVLTNALKSVDKNQFDVSVMGYFWLQGESNPGATPEYYESKFLSMHNAILKGDLGEKFSKCFIAKVRYVTGKNVSATQLNLAEEYNSIVMAVPNTDLFTVENGLMNQDNIHYSQLGNNELGIKFAESVVKTYGLEKEPYSFDHLKVILGILPIIISIALIVGVVMYFRIHRT